MLIAQQNNNSSSNDKEQIQNGIVEAAQNSPTMAHPGKRRRSAAERRAGNRRRSSQQANDIQQLGQLKSCADSAHRRGSSSQCSVHDGEGVEAVQDDEEAAMARHPSSFSSIPDEPPEPPIPAPGAQDDDLQNYPPEQYSLLDALSAELTGMANDLVPQWLGTSPPAQLNGIGLNRTAGGFPAVIHQRSVSDQQLHCGQVERRRQMELGMDQNVDGQQQQSSSPETDHHNQQDHTQTPPKPNASPTNSSPRKTPLLSQIRKLQHEQIDDSMSSSAGTVWHSSSPEVVGRDISTSSTSKGQNGTIPSPNRPKLGASCSTASTSHGFAVNLMNRFTGARQHSDSNLLRTHSNGTPKGQDPQTVGNRRSFKWKSLWGRRTTASTVDLHEKRPDTRRAQPQLGPVPEDAETENSGPKKRHSAALDQNHAVIDDKMEAASCVVRLRAASTREGQAAPQIRPNSICCPVSQELKKYQLDEQQLARLEQFLVARRKTRLERHEIHGCSTDDWDDSIDEFGLTKMEPPRMARPPRKSPASPTCQTLGRPARVQRAPTTRVHAVNALTLPRRKPAPRVPAQLKKRGPAARRKNTTVQVHAVEVAAAVVQQLQQQQEKKVKRTTGTGRTSLKQFLGGKERTTAKVSPKVTDVEAAGSPAELATLNRQDKKREAKANSMILGIWSIRQRRKKEMNAHKSLASMWGGSQADESGADLNFIRGIAPEDNNSNSPHTTHSIQSPPLLSPTMSPFGREDADMFFARPELVQPAWADLDLWAEQPASWAEMHPMEAATLGPSERKRQNVIHELVLTERHHCQVLVLLRQLYGQALARTRLLSEEQLRTLLPEGLDALLDFHLDLLRRLLQRSARASVVDSIADLLMAHFESGRHRTPAVQAYTSFCVGREESCRQFATLHAQNAHFRKFMEFHEGEQLKERTFKDCLLLVAQRLTKYPMLVEQIAKHESTPLGRDLAKRAHEAVKTFAKEVDQGLHRAELSRQWESLKRSLDKSGTAKLIHPKQGHEFTNEDLLQPVEAGQRQVLLLCRTNWRETMNGPEQELRLLLCNDVLLFLRPKGSSTGNGSAAKLPPMQLFRHSAHAGVIPLQYILVRPVDERRRPKSLILIVNANTQPDLFELVFPTSSEMEKCAQAIRRAKAQAPNLVYLAAGKTHKLDEKEKILKADLDRQSAEAEYQACMEQWRKELDQLFEKRESEEAALVRYFEGRMEFMEKLRALKEQMPRRRGATSNEEDDQLERQLRTRFAELNRITMIPLAALAERAQRVKDADLLTLYDDAHDLGSGEQREESTSGDEPRGSADDSSEERRRPRRVSTYHGAVDQRQAENSGGSTSSGSGIRRHTTFPSRQHAPAASSEEEDRAEREDRARLPLRMGPDQRKAAAELLRENVRLRSGLNRMKARAALKEMHLEALKALQKGGKAQEDEEEPRQALEQLALELARKEAELVRRESELRAKEASKCEAAEASTISANKQLDLPETEVTEAKNQQQRSVASIRISNTYCGAGPVPTSNTITNSNGTQSAENSPTQLSDRRALSAVELPRHLAVKTETKQRKK